MYFKTAIHLKSPHYFKDELYFIEIYFNWQIKSLFIYCSLQVISAYLNLG